MVLLTPVSLDGINPLLEAVLEIKDDEANYLILGNEVDVRNAVINEFIEEELEVTKDKVLSVTIRRSEHVNQANAVSAPVRFISLALWLITTIVSLHLLLLARSYTWLS